MCRAVLVSKGDPQFPQNPQNPDLFSVKTDGQMPMVKEALYSKSRGDEAGDRKGVANGTHKDVCEFMQYSLWVKPCTP